MAPYLFVLILCFLDSIYSTKNKTKISQYISIFEIEDSNFSNNFNIKKNIGRLTKINEGVKELIILGISAIIGSGIFAVVGIAAAGPDGAGPALMLSMVIAAIACVFSALCYSEFAAMIPVAGGAYIYTFSTMGEFAAWMVGWVLMLEFVIAEIAVACAWSNYLINFLQGFPFIHNIPAWLVNDPSTLNKLIEEEI